MFEVKRLAWGLAMLATAACGGAGDDSAENGESDDVESALESGERLSYRGYWANGANLEPGRVVFAREGGIPVFAADVFLQDSTAPAVIALRAPTSLGGRVRVIHGDMKCWNDYDPTVSCRLYGNDQFGKRWSLDFRRDVDGSPDRVVVSSEGADTFSTTYQPTTPSRPEGNGVTLGGTRTH